MLADEPNLRVYERAFTGRNSGKGGAPGLGVPVALGARDFAPVAAVPAAATPNIARAAGRKFTPLARQWQRIPGPLATLAGVAALPVHVGWWAFKRWFWTFPLALLLVVITVPLVGRTVPRDARFAEGEQLLHSAARQYQQARQGGRLTNDDLAISLSLRPEELRGRFFRVSREVTQTADGFVLHALPTTPDDPVLVLHVPDQGQPTFRQLSDRPE